MYIDDHFYFILFLCLNTVLCDFSDSEGTCLLPDFNPLMMVASAIETGMEIYISLKDND